MNNSQEIIDGLKNEVEIQNLIIDEHEKRIKELERAVNIIIGRLKMTYIW